MITNEEKALSEGIKYGHEHHGQGSGDEWKAYEQGYIDGCKWKDEKIRAIIDKEIDRANKYFDEHKSKEQMSASVRVVYLLSEFIGETFPKERFHFGFATND